MSGNFSWLAYQQLNGYTPDEIQKICSAAYYRAINRSKEDGLPIKVTLDDILRCKFVLNPILRFQGLKGVGTIMFRERNEDWGRPAIEYPLQDWEKRGADPISLLTLRNRAERRS
ncbi:MAG: hypothetical protein ACFE9L_17880 [Candidatus Hodarchaeota archaeon]